MADVKEFKSKIESMLSQQYKLEFLGKNFEKIVNMLTDAQSRKIYKWILEVIKKEIQPISIGLKKSHKEWKLNQLLVFRYPLNINDNEYRILLVKVKNSVYIEFHLGDHKYYDKVRKDLNLKKSSY